MLDAQGQAVYLSDLASETAQRIFVRLNFFHSEWFLNLDEGAPYYKELMRKGPPARVVRSVLGSIILGTQGVAAMPKFAYSVSAQTRLMRVTFEVKLTDGTTFRSSDFGEFVVSV